MMTNCPCGLDQDYKKCCGPIITGEKKAASPEQLMRSRYTAYTEGNAEYIGKTMIGRASQDFDLEASKQWAESVKWMKLEIVNATTEKEKGSVEFIAHFNEGGKANAIHELSEFAVKDGEWFYIDGGTPQVSTVKKQEVGRNDPCPCGSGKKFKKCCY